MSSKLYIPATSESSVSETVFTNSPSWASAAYNYPGVNSNMKSMSITKIGGALLRAQAKMGNAVKDSQNPFFKSNYADLNAVREACQPLLNAEGILITQPIIQKEGKNYLRTELTHVESGEFFASDVEIVCAKQNDPQALGSSITYARRYGLQALLNLGTQDDDGNAGSGRTTQNTSTPKPASSPRASFKKPTAPTQTVSKTETKVEGWE